MLLQAVHMCLSIFISLCLFISTYHIALPFLRMQVYGLMTFIQIHQEINLLQVSQDTFYFHLITDHHLEEMMISKQSFFRRERMPLPLNLFSLLFWVWKCGLSCSFFLLYETNLTMYWSFLWRKTWKSGLLFPSYIEYYVSTTFFLLSLSPTHTPCNTSHRHRSYLILLGISVFKFLILPPTSSP